MVKILRILSNSGHQLSRSYPPSPRAMPSAPNRNTKPRASADKVATTTQAHHKNKKSSSQKKPLPLPGPGQVSNATQVPVGGEGVKLDRLGPFVVNRDGSMSRISNWANMPEFMRKDALVALGRRNKMRLDALRAKRQSPEGQSGNGN
ncbi:hypothetical protein F5Y00DRAFT_204262 [Daldinia vernicosa]|uniref:uncharacterized protein n=1 Tax=Daldinia vernicosa TaxID=114800 RepID=UPI0020073D7B|nr:uncharacterized protein F5Y00DRAFT_204262 [Daldinia vernicosa]KAI0851955.1 hypothetical protein F5Y00DRAFT_204262 [Daldinia vernicosa]